MVSAPDDAIGDIASVGDIAGVSGGDEMVGAAEDGVVVAADNDIAVVTAVVLVVAMVVAADVEFEVARYQMICLASWSSMQVQARTA